MNYVSDRNRLALIVIITGRRNTIRGPFVQRMSRMLMYEPRPEKHNICTCATSEDSYHPAQAEKCFLVSQGLTKAFLDCRNICAGCWQKSAVHNNDFIWDLTFFKCKHFFYFDYTESSAELIDAFSKQRMLAFVVLRGEGDWRTRRIPETLDGRPLPCHILTPGIERKSKQCHAHALTWPFNLFIECTYFKWHASYPTRLSATLFLTFWPMPQLLHLRHRTKFVQIFPPLEF